MMAQTLNSASLGAMSTLQLHLLYCHLILCACSVCNEVLCLVRFLLFVTLLERLYSACSLLASDETLLIERAVKILNERSCLLESARHSYIRWSPHVRSSWPIHGASLARSVSSAASSCLRATISASLTAALTGLRVANILNLLGLWILLLYVNYCVSRYRFIEQTVLVVCISWDNWRLRNIYVVVDVLNSLILRPLLVGERNNPKAWGNHFLLVFEAALVVTHEFIDCKLILRWVFLRNLCLV